MIETYSPHLLKLKGISKPNFATCCTALDRGVVSADTISVERLLSEAERTAGSIHKVQLRALLLVYHCSLAYICHESKAPTFRIGCILG
jgi:hypothetical protein